jgi:hypothetical protein
LETGQIDAHVQRKIPLGHAFPLFAGISGVFDSGTLTFDVMEGSLWQMTGLHAGPMTMTQIPTLLHVVMFPAGYTLDARLHRQSSRPASLEMMAVRNSVSDLISRVEQTSWLLHQQRVLQVSYPISTGSSTDIGRQ